MSELKPYQLQACSLLAQGYTITKTAEEIGVARVTVSRWVNQDATFAAYTNELKMEQLKATIAKIQASSGLAVETLQSIMKKSKSDMARIAAAKEILSMSGFTMETSQMYAWGVGGTSAEKVKAEKHSAELIEKLSQFTGGLT